MKKLILISLFVLTLLTVGCDESSSSSDETYVSNPNKVGSYVDDSITLPDDVTVIGLDGDIEAGMDVDWQDMLDYLECIGNLSGNGTEEESMIAMMRCLSELGVTGMNGSFSVAITIQNSGSEEKTVTLLAGTILAPDSSGYQPMMLIQDIALVIAAGDTHTFMLPVYCTNSSKNAPDANNCYTLSNITEDSCLVEILAILATKNIDDFSFEDALIAQTSIWNCAENTYDPAADAALNALTDR